MIKKLFFPLFVCVNISGGQDSKIGLFAIPGQNGLGSSPEYVQRILIGKSQASASQLQGIVVETPDFFPDLGQSTCMSDLEKAFNVYPCDKAIIHATSQGTATALNFLGLENKNRRNVKAVILEALIASGNSAIKHTVGGPLMGLHSIASLPGAYYVMPYLAKTQFFNYNPAGKQPIKSIENVPSDIVTILIHSENDMQLSSNDARALYYRLRARGNENTYLIIKDGINHIELCDQEDAETIQAILSRHGIIDYGDKIFDDRALQAYQPEHEQFKHIYDDLIRKERIHEFLPWGALAGAVAVAGYVTHYLSHRDEVE